MKFNESERQSSAGGCWEIISDAETRFGSPCDRRAKFGRLYVNPQALAKALQQNRSIQVIVLQNNHIGDVGVEAWPSHRQAPTWDPPRIQG